MSSLLVLHLDLAPIRGDLRTRHKKGLRQFLPWLLLCLFFLSLSCMSCGGLVTGPPAPIIVTVTPNSAEPFTGSNVQFQVAVKNAANSAVTWQVNQIPGGNQTVGTITAAGLYTAPNLVPTPPTVAVTAVLQADPSAWGSANVTIQSAGAIQGPLTLAPAISSLTTSQNLQLNVLTAGVTNTSVNWAVDGTLNGSATLGTISPSGLYTPPNAAGSHLITATLIANPSVVGSAQVDVTDFPGMLTSRNDNSRSGVNSGELALAPATVNSSAFGRIFSCPIDGYAYAQPLYVPNLVIPGNGTHNVVFVVTEMDSAYAFDADDVPCVQLWHTSLIPAGSEAVPTPNSNITSTDIVPFVGITGTPVISLDTSALYVVAMTVNSAAIPVYDERLYALDLATGQPKIQPAGVPVNGLIPQTASFEPVLENQRAALLLDNSTVYVAFGSFHNLGDYHGWLFAYDSASLQLTGFFNVTPNAFQGGIWQSGGGPSADANHNVYVVTGDGPFDANRGGSSYSDSFLKLGTSGGLSVSDYFTPCDQSALQTSGLDLGASAPVLLPDSAGSPAEPHLMIGGAKNGSLYVVNRDNLGQFSSTCPDASPRVQVIPVGDGPILSTPLFWNNSVFVAAGNGNLKSFPMSAGTLATSPSAEQSPESLGPQGSTPVISSNGANNAILWLIDTSGALASPNAPVILRAFDPNNLSNEIYNSAMTPNRDPAGLAVKFTVPTVANGKVYVGTQTELDVYGFLH
jgi:hypothetical protein